MFGVVWYGRVACEVGWGGVIGWSVVWWGWGRLGVRLGWGWGRVWRVGGGCRGVCGVVWCGRVEWSGVECGVVLRGVVWCGVVLGGVVEWGWGVR